MTLCVECSHVNPEGAALCERCDAPLRRVCGRCRTVNWVGEEVCTGCGRPLDVEEMIGRQSEAATSDRLRQQMAESRQIKELEALASDRRMAEMMAAEEARLADLRRRQALVKARERQLMMFVFGALALFFLMVLVYFLLA